MSQTPLQVNRYWMFCVVLKQNQSVLPTGCFGFFLFLRCHWGFVQSHPVCKSDGATSQSAGCSHVGGGRRGGRWQRGVYGVQSLLQQVSFVILSSCRLAGCSRDLKHMLGRWEKIYRQTLLRCSLISTKGFMLHPSTSSVAAKWRIMKHTVPPAQTYWVFHFQLLCDKTVFQFHLQEDDCFHLVCSSSLWQTHSCFLLFKVSSSLQWNVRRKQQCIIPIIY